MAYLEQSDYPDSIIEHQAPPKFMEKVVSFFRTRINGALVASILPAIGGGLAGVAMGPVGALVGAAAVGLPFAVGGYQFGKRVENNMYARPNLTAPNKLERLSSSLALRVNETLGQAYSYGALAGLTGMAATANPGVGVATGIVGAIAGGIGGWNFGNRMRQNIYRADATTNNAFPSFNSNVSPLTTATSFIPTPTMMMPPTTAVAAPVPVM